MIKNHEKFLEDLKNGLYNDFSLDKNSFFEENKINPIKSKDSLNFYNLERNNLEKLKNQNYIIKNYFILENIPKSLGVTTINEELLKLNIINNFEIFEAIRFKNFLRCGYILSEEESIDETITKNLNDMSFNNSKIEITKKNLNDFKILSKTYKNEEQVFLDFYYANEMVKYFGEFFKIEIKPLFDLLKNKSIFYKLDILSFYLFKVFHFLVYNMKFYKNFVNLNNLGCSFFFRNNININEENFSKFDLNNVSSSYFNYSDRYYYSKTEIQKYWKYLLNNQNSLKLKVEEKLKEKLKESMEGTWPCIKCEKIFETKDYLQNHFLQKHKKAVEKYRKKFFNKEIINNFFNDKNRHYYINYEKTHLSYIPIKKTIIIDELEKIRSKSKKRKIYNKYITDYQNL